MMLVVTGVGSVIHIFSIGYMYEEYSYYRYFAYLNLFLFSMLLLVMGNNFLVMFIGWEGVGACSYFLIGYYFEKNLPATRQPRRLWLTGLVTSVFSSEFFTFSRPSVRLISQP